MTDLPGKLAWGAKVSVKFRARVVETAVALHIDPSWLMACMAFESARTFSPSIRNGAGSGAVGLIQFMPQTCATFGLTVEDMAAMTDVDQLSYVRLYFEPWVGRLHNLGDVYGAILWPAMIGKPPSWPVFRKDDQKHPARYLQNRGLDFNHDGEITKDEIVMKVQNMYVEGMQPGNVYVGYPGSV